MSLVSDIITAAFRETNLIPVGTVPTTNQITEALGLLNTIVLSSVGNEIGDELRDLNIGGIYDESDYTLSYVPFNARLVLSLTAARTLYLNPEPYPGQRLAVSDAAGNLATYNLVIDGNGRKIEGTATITLNTNSDSRQWIYRADISTWTKITSLISSDPMPFPVDFDDYFTTALAIRLNPRFSQQMTQETVEAFKRAKKNIVARFRSRAETYPEYIGILGQVRRNSVSSKEFGRGGFWWR